MAAAVVATAVAVAVAAAARHLQPRLVHDLRLRQRLRKLLRVVVEFLGARLHLPRRPQPDHDARDQRPPRVVDAEHHLLHLSVRAHEFVVLGRARRLWLSFLGARRFLRLRARFRAVLAILLVGLGGGAVGGGGGLRRRDAGRRDGEDEFADGVEEQLVGEEADEDAWEVRRRVRELRRISQNCAELRRIAPELRRAPPSADETGPRRMTRRAIFDEK